MTSWHFLLTLESFQKTAERLRLRTLISTHARISPALQWHGAMLRFSPRPRPQKTARSHANTLSTEAARNQVAKQRHKYFHRGPHGVPQTRLDTTTRSPATRRVYTHAQLALRHANTLSTNAQNRNFAPDRNNITPSLVDTANHPAPQRHAVFTHACSSLTARSHAKTPSTEAAQNHVAQQHHKRNFATAGHARRGAETQRQAPRSCAPHDNWRQSWQARK